MPKNKNFYEAISLHGPESTRSLRGLVAAAEPAQSGDRRAKSIRGRLRHRFLRNHIDDRLSGEADACGQRVDIDDVRRVSREKKCRRTRRRRPFRTGETRGKWPGIRPVYNGDVGVKHRRPSHSSKNLRLDH